jgi:hypothetical protein
MGYINLSETLQTCDGIGSVTNSSSTKALHCH